MGKYLGVLFAFVLAFSLVVMPTLSEVEASPSWWDSSWQYRQKLTFDNSGQSENLVNFPVLVKLTEPTNIDYANTQDNGQDIRFVDSDDVTQLSYEIEEWNETGDSWIWVKVPQIDGSSNTDYIYMYYGNPSAPDGQNLTEVWDSNFVMVQHLHEGSGTTVEDSTANGNDGTIYGSLGTTESGTNNTLTDSDKSWTTDEWAGETIEITGGTGSGQTRIVASNTANVTTVSSNWVTNPDATSKYRITSDHEWTTSGQLGNAIDFDEVDDLIRVPDSASLDGTNDEGTFELLIWFDDAADGDHQFVMSSSNRFTPGASNGYEWASQGNGNHFFYPWGGNNNNYNLGPNPFTNQVWHHLVVTLEDTGVREVKIYVDTVSMSFTIEQVPTYWTQLASPDDWLWGGNPDRSTRYFDGMMDEVRISDTVRSDDWIKAQYLSMTDAFITYGGEEEDDEGNGDDGGSIPVTGKCPTNIYFGNRAPVADASGPYYRLIEEEIEFDGSGSYDLDGVIIHYGWSFGDGTTGYGEKVTHTYSNGGSYLVTLTISDNNGTSDTDKTTAFISAPNRTPSIPKISGPTDGSKDTRYSYAFGSTDQDNDDMNYIIDWGDGSTDESVFLPSGHYFSMLHSWAESGMYTITVTASDNQSTSSYEMTVLIEENILADNIAIVALVLTLLALMIFLMYTKKGKKKK